MDRLLTRGLVALAAIAVSGASQAVVIYNNFGSGTDYGWFDGDSQGWGVFGSGVMGSGQRVYESFDTGSFSGMLTSISVGVSLMEGPSDVVVSLLADKSGVPDDLSVLGTWDLTDIVAWGADPTPPPETITAGPIALAAGTKYWVLVAPGQDKTYADWGWSDPLVSGTFYLGSGNGVYIGRGNLSAMEVEGDPTGVPAPAAVVPFALGLLAFRRRARR